MGFYRIHMLDVIAIDFLIVPIIMTGGGVLTIVIFLTGMTAIIKEDTSWLITFSILTILNFFVLLIGVISSVRFVEYSKLCSITNTMIQTCCGNTNWVSEC